MGTIAHLGVTVALLWVTIAHLWGSAGHWGSLGGHRCSLVGLMRSSPQVLSPGLRAAEVAQILRALLDLYGNDCSAGGAPLRPTAPPSAPHFRSSPRPASPPPAPRTEPRRRHVVPSHQ